MLFLRLRQAEIALADGRLDEAYGLISRDDVREHRRGQQLTTRLVARLTERSRQHLQKGRLQEALADCERAKRLAGNQTQLVELQTEIVAAMQAEREQRERRRKNLNDVRGRIERGDLTLGGKLLDGLDENGEDAATDLPQQLALRRNELEAALARAEHAIEHRSFSTAVAALREATEISPKNQKLLDLTTALLTEVSTQMRERLDAGRLDQAESLRRLVDPLANGCPEMSEHAAILDRCLDAAAQLVDGNVHQALGQLQRLRQLLPEAKWLKSTIEQVDQATAALDSLTAGPLGLLAATPATPMSAPAKTARLPSVLPQKNSGTVLPDSFIMQVDGAGSFLVVAKRRLRIGLDRSSNGSDVALQASAKTPTFSIERLDDDYFLQADEGVQVNGRPVQRKLLADGDTLTVGQQHRMKFRLPNPASTTAMLDLTGARLTRRDIRKVILLDESLILGPPRSAHVSVTGIEQPLVLRLHDQRLFAASDRSDNEPNPAAIAMNRPVEVNGMTIVLNEVAQV